MPNRLGVFAGLLLVAACAPHARTVETGPHPVEGSFRFEGEPALGEIRVVPLIRAYEAPPLRVDGYVTEGIVDARIALRERRMDQLTQVPGAMTVALPGAIHARLDDAWTGHFKVGHLSRFDRTHLETALERGDRDALDLALAEAARSVGGQATLFTWVTNLSADPLTAEGFPGDQVQTASGPVVLDIFEEPYRVRAELGMALVRSDGRVVLRYVDHGETLLSGHRDASRAGRDLANALAVEVVKMWPDDPRLWRVDPPSFDHPRALVAEDKSTAPILEGASSAVADDAPRRAEVPFQGLRKAGNPRGMDGSAAE